ncbi:ABC-2 transporter permease [Romboutsia lituseburensis]|uniref:ABC-2 family transporter protein n=1 Tax=Romboutsia lituseburensis DSM 797 TaxID=1121325 RepID=A0A1G9MAV0_9FIRM|nr:ABC-2 transporter permease [Romboutsia lituseburensis]CEH34538.1 ABC-2 family transporter protein [Romboutsia lituseburensis]SDL71339.1 ABC-2 family transporter protein [Romboutsia lituseburensis DSM 797]
MNNIINLTKMSFLNLKSVFKQIWLIAAIWIVVSAFNPTFLNMLFGMIIVLTVYQVMAYEDMNGIDNIISVMPVKKKEYVLSRYLMGIIALFISIIIVSIEYFVALKLNQNLISLDVLLVAGGTVGVIAMCIVIPILLKFGINKGRVVVILIMMVLMMIPSGVIGYLAESPEAMEKTIEMINNVGISLIAFVLNFVVLAISTTISIKIYENKEIK